MRIGILSDIHDNIPKLRSALKALDGVDVVVCCGDLCSPFIVKELATGFSGPIHVVFGNNDGDRFRIAGAASTYDNIELHGEYAELEFDGCRFSVNHFDNIGRACAGSSAFDVICFGHNHQFEITETDGGLIINPGEIFGHLTGTSSLAIYDTKTRQASRVNVE